MDWLIGIILAAGLVLIIGSLTSSDDRDPEDHSGLPSWLPRDPGTDDIRSYGINEILSSGKFTAEERKAEYRRRGRSPSGVIDGIYNDAYRGNDSYNDSYRDWDADA